MVLGGGAVSYERGTPVTVLFVRVLLYSYACAMVKLCRFTGTPVPSDRHSLPPRALRGGISKSFFERPCQFLTINAHKMAPRTSKRLKERAWDTPTKGLLWGPSSRPSPYHPRSFVGVSQKSICNRPCQFLAINAHKMAPRTKRRLQERRRDTPTKDLLWPPRPPEETAPHRPGSGSDTGSA